MSSKKNGLNGVADAHLSNGNLTNGEQNLTEYDDCDVWLLAKPVDMPEEELMNIRFPRKPRSNAASKEPQLLQVSSRKTKTATKVECRFHKPSMQMFHLEVGNIQSTKQLKKLKPSAKIKGVAWMTQRPILDDDCPVLPDDDLTEPTAEDLERWHCTIPSKIHDIRDNPKLLDALQK